MVDAGRAVAGEQHCFGLMRELEEGEDNAGSREQNNMTSALELFVASWMQCEVVDDLLAV